MSTPIPAGPPPVDFTPVDESEETERRGLLDGALASGQIDQTTYDNLLPLTGASNPFASLLFLLLGKLIEAGATIKVVRLENNQLQFEISLDAVDDMEAAALSRFLGTLASAALAAGAGTLAHGNSNLSKPDNLTDSSAIVTNITFQLGSSATELVGVKFDGSAESLRALKDALAQNAPDLDLDSLDAVWQLLPSV